MLNRNALKWKMETLKFGYSPCPNDTFLFYALAHAQIDTQPFAFDIRHHDITTLNKLALAHTYELSKVSLFLYGQIREKYALLPSGAALGKGYGPLILTSPHASSDPTQWKIGFPGQQTTAYLLGRLWQPSIKETVFLPFSDIIQHLRDGKLDAGIVIHESRFTFEKYGLNLFLDLGAWWQETTNLPLPLGVICASRTLTVSQRGHLADIVRQSLHHAQAAPDAPLAYIKAHAQESADDNALKRHIGLYVNEYTEDLGDQGIEAIQYLLKKAEILGLLRPSQQNLF